MIKLQCIHSDMGLCKSCWEYEQQLAEERKKVSRLEEIARESSDKEFDEWKASVKKLYFGENHKSFFTEEKGDGK